MELYKLKMAVERAFKAGKVELVMKTYDGGAVAITAHRLGRPDLSSSVVAFTY